ncbi:DNA polymerase III, alpha subunit [Nitrosospira sp. Nsp18]|uniref:DNA polymerase III subunit alpha n=1 Tax=Nitrosospira sp. Nsp18 TaxID=1855334 RepID=UPI00088B498A|nr:DNA polymerase III subunit alpha [Nitrosospira sp. Nsp18]SDA16667.1 DNA polymerase III, alpha subunit [Nitrosospira sp. Nsp18]
MPTSTFFVHLRLHSEFSVVDGIVRIDEAVAKAVADDMPALALTDLSNLFGLVKFYQEARKKGIKPIIGCDVWISNESDRDKPGRILLLCQSYQGYLLLCRLLSRAYRENQHRGRAEVRKSWLERIDGGSGAEGLIALSGAGSGEIGLMLLQNDPDQAEQLAREWADLFPGRFYIEVQRAGHPNAEALVQRSLMLASALRLPVVATHPVQFLNPEDYRAHEARVCIAEGYVLGDRRRPKNCTEEQYFKTQAEMAELFADIPSALANTVALAKRCNLALELGVNRLPLFPTPNSESLELYLRTQAAEGLEVRLNALFPDAVQRDAEMPKYYARLDFEADVIIQMGFAGYFLIVADFINWAKHNGVPVGPGRGSGAGSLVAYSLGITDLDPLRYDLLFERFLNPERVSMPDFDIDFCQDGRENVIDYVKQKYGAESVSQIATFGTMAAKAVVRDVGRVLDLPYSFVDQLAKLVPFEIGMTLKKAREEEPQLNERAQAEEEVRNLLELAERLEGLTRNVGMHAGGVLIASGKITDFCPIYCTDSGESVISQLDKDDVEKIGLVKFDFLGLRTLTILDWTVRYIRQRNRDAAEEESAPIATDASKPAAESGIRHSDSFSLENLPLDDAATYALLRQGNAVGVFQFESRGMKDLLQKARPDRFEDIIALVALYRPGPMALIPEFTERKHGKRVEYLDPRLKPILEPTYGVMVYQEQVMQIAQVIGGYSLGAADLLRRAMGKKQVEEMALHRDIFVAGATKNGLTERIAAELFDLMEKFAGYGFNKSHAAAYALIAFQTAYLKAHYPAEFMAATLSADMDDTDKVNSFFEDSVANGLIMLPPDINLSDYRFVPVDKKTIRYGLGAIKGTGSSAIAAIIKVRDKSGPFSDLFDFCQRVDKRIVNRRVMESLIRAGAFDSVNAHRARLLASVGIALESAEQADRAVNQVSLFGEADSDTGPSLINVPPWPEKEKLKNEKVALGLYLSGHPFHAYAEELKPFVRTRLDRLNSQREIQLLAGIVYAIRTQVTRRGRMGVIVLDDGSTRVELVVYNELFESVRTWLKEDQLLIVEAKVNGRGGDDEYGSTLRITADQLYDLNSARTRFAKRMELHCNGNGPSNAIKLKELLAPHRHSTNNGNSGNTKDDDKLSCPVRVVYHNRDAMCELELGDAWRVRLQDNLLQSLSAHFDAENVKVIY